MGCAGGTVLRGITEDLETRLENYLGSLNEIRLGLRQQSEEKPAELIVYEQIVELKQPLLEGGIMDQPHIWLMQYAICKNHIETWRRIIDAATKPSGQS